MKFRNLFINSALVAGGTLTAASTGNAASQPPNVIIIYTDDQGYADLSCQDILSDIATPHLDALAADGVRFTDGYITAPQCGPSRAGLLSGRYQERYGFDSINQGPLPLEAETIADRLKKAGYTTGMTGKWHIEPLPGDLAFQRRNNVKFIRTPGRHPTLPDEVMLPYMPENRGFDEYLCSWDPSNTFKDPRYNFTPDSDKPTREGQWGQVEGYRTHTHTAAALNFIERRKKNEPFFFYLAYSIPHTPLEAPQKYLDRFPGDMPERRRTALAMMAAMDDGIGEIVKLLKERGQYENTLFCYASDNGAPMKMKMEDEPLDKKGGWDGSRNDPMNGEKGMLTEGGIRVPFFMTWKDRIPSGKVYTRPAIALDFTATAVAAAGQPLDNLDGVDLLPYLTGERRGDPHEALCWRFWTQSAIRSGDWKLLRLGDTREYLFNLENDKEEQHNLLAKHPEKADELRGKLEAWASEMRPPRLPAGAGLGIEKLWFNYFLNRQRNR
jgi:arylsulfatase A-like enzyme